MNSPPQSPGLTSPLKVRLTPRLVESVCALARSVRDKGNAPADITGLLYGKSEPGTRTLEMFKAFDEAAINSDLARRERLDKAYKLAVQEAKADPKLAAYETVGWFSFRHAGGLLSSDVAFHNQSFRKPDDVALVIWREGPSQITAEFYAKGEGEILAPTDYRWGSVRLSADIRQMRDALEIIMREKLEADSYLRTYDSAKPEVQFSDLMRKAEDASKKLLERFSRRSEASQSLSPREPIEEADLPDMPEWSPGSDDWDVSSQSYFNPQSNTERRMQARKAELAVQSADAEGPASGTPPPHSPANTIQDPRPVPNRGPSVNASTAGAAQQSVSSGKWSDASLESLLRKPQTPTAPAPAFAPTFTPPRSLDLHTLGQLPLSTRASSPEPSRLPMLLRPSTSKKSVPWLLAVLVFALFSVAVFALLLFGGPEGDSGRLGQAFHAMFPSGELNMRVRTEDDRLRLTWNQRNRAVATAVDGTLQILDGRERREVHLEGQQVLEGSVLYRPLTNDVTFRLEVHGEQGATSGSVRVLDGLPSQQKSLDVSATKTQANPASGTATANSEPSGNSALPVPADPNAPTILRSSKDASGSRLSPPTRVPRSSPHSVSPQSTATSPDMSGSNIHSWETSNSKARATPPTRPAGSAVSDAGRGNFVPPRPLMQVMPRTSTIPNGTIQTRTQVQVQLRVDPTGKVASARLVGPPVNEIIASAALAAARQWTFQPASSNGTPVESEHTIVFEFRPDR